MLKNLFGNNKIQVEFTDANTGELIARSAMKPGELPETFELNTTLNLQFQEWAVTEADPVHSKDFIASGALKLKLQKIQKIDPNKILYTLPTISNEFPIVAGTPAFDNFKTNFFEDDWRQREFLNRSSLPLVEIEIEETKKIWKDHSKKVEGNFNAFTKIHVRRHIGLPGLNIDLKKLQELLAITQTGSAYIDSRGFLENGFSFETENTTYLGVVLNGIVTELCILTFNENSLSEIKVINHQFGLIHVDWYNCHLIDES
jgi:hypothetical protein